MGTVNDKRLIQERNLPVKMRPDGIMELIERHNRDNPRASETQPLFTFCSAKSIVFAGYFKRAILLVPLNPADVAAHGLAKRVCSSFTAKGDTDNLLAIIYNQSRYLIALYALIVFLQKVLYAVFNFTLYIGCIVGINATFIRKIFRFCHI